VTGSDGIEATLPVLPFDGFFRGAPRPSFQIDPVVLDAAGQVIGFWTMEHLDSARLIFPFRVTALDVHGPLRPTGERIACRAAVALVGEQQVKSDIEMIGADGQLWMRLEGWEDKRFALPERFYPLLLAVNGAEVSEPWLGAIAGALAAHPEPEAVECRLVDMEFPSDRGFWKRVWVGCVLSAAERDLFESLELPEPRQLEWLAGRTAAKDAVRRIFLRRYGVSLKPADVEVLADERGCPRVRLLPADAWEAWARATGARVAVSISHSGGRAASVAAVLREREADGIGAPGLGIDIEVARTLPAGVPEMILTGAERALIEAALPASATADVRDEWLLRAWCAKEAAGKALGHGLPEGPASARVAGIDAGAQTVHLAIEGGLAQVSPALTNEPITVHTGRHGDLVVATTLCEPGSQTHGDNVHTAARRAA
jgi:phosphopantetheinyl transferase (holo-ACP synthase)